MKRLIGSVDTTILSQWRKRTVTPKLLFEFTVKVVTIHFVAMQI